MLWWKRGRIARRDWICLAPFLALGAAAGLATAWLERHHVGAVGEVWSPGILERVLTAGRVVWFYAAKFFFPANLVFIHPGWELSAGSPFDWFFPLAAAAVPAALWLLRGRIGRGPACAVLVYGLLIAPASGFFDVYFFRYAPVQDHFQYFACTGLAAFAASPVARALPRPVPFARSPWFSSRSSPPSPFSERPFSPIRGRSGAILWRATRAPGWRT